MRGLKEIIYANKAWSERLAKEWRVGQTISCLNDIKNLHPFPHQKDRKVIFACEVNQKSLQIAEHLLGSDCTEETLPKLFSELLENFGSFSIVYVGGSAKEIRIVLWI